MSRESHSINFDAAAGRPLSLPARRAMDRSHRLALGNPHTFHAIGRCALSVLDDARLQISDFFGVHPLDLILTSGATESNNLMLQGTVRYWNKRGQSTHIIISAIEHSSLLKTALLLEEMGHAVSYLPVRKNGLVRWEMLATMVRPETRCISVMTLNNETGAIQPIRAIRRWIRQCNEARERIGHAPIIFHTDAVQAIETLPCDLVSLGVDALSFSAHKIGGPKGIGGLVRRRDTVPLLPMWGGGDQESGLRPGTVPVSLVVGCAAALEAIELPKSLPNANKKRDRFIKELRRRCPSLVVHGPLGTQQVPWMVNVAVPDCDGEALLIALDRAGFCCSAGSACLTGARTPSHVLLAMGSTTSEALSSFRVSWEPKMPLSMLLSFARVFGDQVNRIRAIMVR
jgi:cysteine desulfurase